MEENETNAIEPSDPARGERIPWENLYINTKDLTKDKDYVIIKTMKEKKT